jgi:hypothetical protein
MKVSFLVTAVAPSILAMAATWGFPASVMAEDKFGPWRPPVNLGPAINSKYVDERPAISRDNLSLYFDSDRPGGVGGTDIWVSQRTSVNDPWGTPQNLGPVINSAKNETTPALSPNGHWLFFGSDRPGGCGSIDIWASHRKDRDDDFTWEPPVNLGCTLNSAYDDDFPTLFVDNEEDVTILYFASNRSGNYHIYTSTMNEEDGTFGPGVLVPEINCFEIVCTRDSRTTIRRDGLEIIFGSWMRPGGFGKQDLWVSTRKETEDPWSIPVNLGPVVNTKDNEGGPALSRDGTTLYFHSDRPGGVGGLDLYVTKRAKLRKHEEDKSDSGR